MKKLLITVLVLATVIPTIGCNWLTAGTILLGPRQVDKMQFKLTENRLAVFIDYANADEESPVFDRAFYDQLATVFREQQKFVPSQLVTFQELVDLRRSAPDFRTWSVQRIGRELEADQVLYVRIEQLRLRQTPDHPLLEPAVVLQFKVIGVPDPAEHARLWPEEPAGRPVACQRMAEEAVGPDAIDAAAAKLAREAAREVAMPFYDVDLEETPPKEA